MQTTSTNEKIIKILETIEITQKTTVKVLKLKRNKNYDN